MTNQCHFEWNEMKSKNLQATKISPQGRNDEPMSFWVEWNGIEKSTSNKDFSTRSKWQTNVILSGMKWNRKIYKQQRFLHKVEMTNQCHFEWNKMQSKNLKITRFLLKVEMTNQCYFEGNVMESKNLQETKISPQGRNYKPMSFWVE